MWMIFDQSDEEAVTEMDRFVRSHTNSHFLQASAWAQVKTFWDWRGIIVWKEGKIAATVLVLIRPLPLGFSLLYAPRGPVCDRNDRTVWAELMDALKRLARQKHALLIHMDPDELDDNQDFRALMMQLGFHEKADDGFGNIQPQYVFRLPLKGRTQEEVFQSFCPKTRYNIGLALRKGVAVREYSGADPIPESILEDFYTLMQTTGERDHFFIRGQDYFKGLMKALQNHAKIYLAYLHGQPIAGSIEVFCGNKAWYLYGASANEHRNAMPNYLLQWTMIQEAIARSCELYDFRGVPGNVSEDHPLYGLYRFKKGFNGNYTKFTGLFTYAFRPILSRLLELAMRIRRKSKPKTRR